MAPTEEAVRLRRELAATNPAFIPDLAMALNNLDRRCAQVGESDRAEAAWRATLAMVGEGAAAFLYAARAQAVDAGHPDAARWLVEASRLAGDDRGLIGYVHAQARRHRDADPARFDATWSERTGEPAPAWLLVDPALLSAAQGWIATETYGGERDYLAAHPELLGPSADDAVGEALLAVGEEEAGRYVSLREVARVDGVEVAYRPLLLTILAREFVRADPAGQRALLAERRDDLFSDTVTATLRRLARDDNTGAVPRAVVLLDLARLGEHEPVFDALAEPARFRGLLAGLAARPNPAALHPAALVAYTAATTPAEGATAGFYLAVAAAIRGDQQQAGTLLAEARKMDPERSAAWIGTLADLGQIHPEVLPLIPALAAPPATAEPSEEDS
ncbi:MAG TPA: hypothetical protein VFX70_02960 [Mycobacteriales bacterium]|nr:hypothetical protein [Mycobacteriales bacterium]